MKNIVKYILTIHLLCLVACNTNDGNGQLMESQEEELPVEFFKTGNSDTVTNPLGGICMMGGRTENDNAMRWFLQRAQGGDVLVMRASGADGYNSYFYSELGVAINSVETMVFRGKTEHPVIINRINQAEAIWFAGGNQGNYIAYWKDNKIEEALQRAIDRGAVIGGTSAGMAILGEFVWTGTQITTDFLAVPFLENTITDTHFSERDRMPRLQGYILDTGANGIAADEYTAICVDADGLARVYGEVEEDDFAFFITSGLNVNQVKGLPNGENSFDLTNW